MGQAASRQEAFWEACGFGHKDRVKKFLEEGDIDVNWVSYTHDCCPIHVASQGKPEIVRMLLDKGANVNVKDVRGNLPIHHAAMKGHFEVVQILLDAGSEVNTQEKNGWTPLHCAAYWNRLDVVKCLLKNSADVSIQNKDERTALHETARSQAKGDFQLGEIAQCLIEAGSDVNAKSSDLGEADFTGLMFASYHNHPEVATALIQAGCEINAFGTRNELASDRCTDNEMKEMVMNAVNMFEELSILDRKDSSVGKPKGEAVSTRMKNIQPTVKRDTENKSVDDIVLKTQSDITADPVNSVKTSGQGNSVSQQSDGSEKQPESAICHAEDENKFAGQQLRSHSYKVKTNQCFCVPTDLPTLPPKHQQHFVHEDDDKEEDATHKPRMPEPNIFDNPHCGTYHPGSPPIPEVLSTPPCAIEAEQESPQNACAEDDGENKRAGLKSPSKNKEAASLFKGQCCVLVTIQSYVN
uniref:Ankyrin-3 n=1 Tax=Magallana gigas TaxID=29159 RepID=K1RLA6_MAGGI